MQPTTQMDVYERPGKIRIALAVAWLIVSLIVGGAIGAQQPATGPLAAPTEVSTAGR